MTVLPPKRLRTAFGEALLSLAEEFPELVVLDADISRSLRTVAFARAYPARHFDFGAAEQGMMAAAAGLATTGKVPLACTYAVFASMRACEQVRSFICYPRLNVKIIASHGGLEVGWDGPTHQGIEDVAIMRSLPHMVVVAPADAVAVPALLRAAIEHDGPVYFRMGRNPVPIVYDEAHTFALGQAIVVREGKDVTLVAAGAMVAQALEAAGILEDMGIAARVLDMHTIKPMDGPALERAARETGAIVTAEDHTFLGGLGAAVAEHLGEHCPTPLTRIGLRDTFGESGDPAELLAKYGMSAQHIARAAERVIERKVRSAPGNQAR
jgi:transketolase